MIADLELGARVSATGVRFRVWAPSVHRVGVSIWSAAGPGVPIELARGSDDVWTVDVPGIGAGVDYAFVLDGSRTRPDPVSRSQPEGVHGPSRVVDPAAYVWGDAG